MPAPTLSPPALTLRQITDALIYTGEQWTTAQLTFSIPSTGATWPDYGAGEEQDTGFSPLTATQAADFRIAITVWDDLIAPSIREVLDVGGPGSIRIAFSSYEELAGEAGAYAYGPLYR